MWKLSCAGLALGLALACNTSPQPNEAVSATTGQEQPAAEGPACGKVTCAVGEVCCNPSCSVCTAPDGMCTQQLCMDDDQRAAIDLQTGTPATPEPGTNEPAAPPPEGDSKMSCANVRCMAGTHCEMVQVQCIRAPCNPVPECKPDANAEPAAQPAMNKQCGKNTCSGNQTCCNASCGICTPPGGSCIQMLCPDGQMPKR